MRAATGRVPRLGFVGAGWIGRHRMESVCASGAATAAVVAEPDPALLAAALESAPGAQPCHGLDDLLELASDLGGLDGVVIATPSALHAEQSLQALAAGLPVFCQKPLGRTAGEAWAVVEAARRADLRLGVDLSYRFVEGARRIRDLVLSGELGTIYAARLVFHNAYGPDKAWFYDRARSGGGCVIDLGTHLIDLLLWTLGELGVPAVTAVTARCFAGGVPLCGCMQEVEDYAVAQLELAGGAVAEIACSWKLPAGQDAVIAASFYGTAGGAELRNVNGSFYDFVAERFRGTSRETLSGPPDAWGGRALECWARRLATDRGFDAEVESAARVAEVVDRIYGWDQTAQEETA
ncbi:MAG TPA: Gfo/Idh/MocA family oxidoreductase [Thermoanaerobaculia bacterium]